MAVTTQLPLTKFTVFSDRTKANQLDQIIVLCFQVDAMVFNLVKMKET